MSERPVGPSDRSSFSDLSQAGQQRADQMCDRFEAQWQAGTPPRIEDFVQDIPAAEQRALLQELILLDVAYRHQRGEAPQAAEYHQRFSMVELAWLQQATARPLGKTSVTAAPASSAALHALLDAAPASAATAVPLMLGDYLLLDRLGEGGMGVVYRARHRRMGRIVAVKMLRPHALAAETSLARFQREIRLIAQLSHPNIVAAFDAGEQDGIHFLVMELVEGADLASLVAREGPLPVARAVPFVLQAAAGLRHAHEQGLVHRDVKPHNLLVNRQGVVKVLDLGLARMTGASTASGPDSHGASYKTHSDAVLGTFHFMAPEQALNTRNADHRSDIYSLGCTLHYLLIGKPMYTGETGMEVFLAHAQEPVVSLRAARPDVPPALDGVFQRMVAKQPEQRQQSLAEVSDQLRGAIGATGPVPTGPGLPPVPAMPAPTALMSVAAPADRRRRRIGWIAAGALACLSLILGLIQLSGLGWFRSTPSQPADPDWHTNSIGMRLRRLPAGQFEMGRPPGFIEPLLARMKKFPAQGYQPGQLEREMPARQASIDQPFAIGATEVTNAQFQAFVDATSYVTDAERLPAGGWGIAPNGQWTQAKGYSWRNLGQQPRTPEYPAVSISWNDAMAFCQWLTEKEPSAGPRVTYRLPTEAEWEYACRGRSTSPWGPAASAAQLGEYAWFVANSSGRIQPVAKKAANAWGLHDMLGNEMEWCLNRHDVNVQDSQPPGDPRNPDSGERRVQRGGAFNDVADLVRPACRYLGHPSSPAHGAFRVVRVVE